MRIKITLLMVLFIFGFLMVTVEADVIHLKNGRIIEGLIEKEKNDEVVLNVGFGTVKFHKDAIEKIEKSSPEEAKLFRENWQTQRKLEEKRWQEIEKERTEAKKRKEFKPKDVPFSQDLGHIIVDALLNEKVKASLLLDTGASTMLLSNEIAKRLKIKTDKTAKDNVMVQLANGEKIEAKYVVLDSVKIEDVEAKNVGAVVLSETIEMQAHDGLLGMSFLNNFNFEIDTTNKKLILQKKNNN